MYEPFDEQHKIFTNVITKEPLDVVIQTTGHKIVGKVHVRPGQRLTDEINTDEPFLAVTEAKIFDGSGTLLIETKFIAVGRTQIIWIVPEKEI